MAVPLPQHDWIGLDDSLARTVIGRWMHESVPEARVVCRSVPFPALCEAARAGLGLQCCLATLATPRMGCRRAVQKTLSEPRSALWLLTHNSLKRTARIRAVMDFLATAFGSERALLEGKQPADRTSAKAPVNESRIYEYRP